ncbi:hypothetical protein KKB28_05005, partial [bacterium]|nr:hypothetical protein [bacterium]
MMSKIAIRGFAQKSLSFLFGALLLCVFSTIHTIISGFPLYLKGYVMPFFLGGFGGLALGFWNRTKKQ